MKTGTTSQRPLFSIVTVNRDNAIGLFKTLSSVAGQTFRNFEEIVVDGGSTDGSASVPERIPGCEASVVSEPDTGIYNAMNKGIGRSAGRYLLFLNSGDWLWDRDVLALVADAVQNRPADMVYGDYMRTDGTGRLRLHRQPETLTPEAYHPPRTWGVCHQTIFYSRDVLERTGGYDERFRIASDWHLTLRALVGGASARHLPLPICYYDCTGISSRPEHEEQANREIKDVRRSLHLDEDK